MTTPEPTFRPLTAGELDLFLALDDPDGAGPAFGPPGRDFLTTVAAHQYRPEWTWIAQRGDRVVARAAWWGGPDNHEPYALDWFDLGPDDDRVDVGARLLQAAHAAGADRTTDGSRAAFHLLLPPDWRDEPARREGVDERTRAAERAGLRPFVERLRLEWDRSTGPPPSPGRLRFGPVPDDGELLDLLRRINVGTFDAHAGRDLDREGPEAAARIQLDDMSRMPGPRTWWRTATTPAGELVGLVMPSRNHEMAVIGYLGVVPEQRGNGYVDDLLAEGTAVLAAEGVDRIRADTDVANTPMAAAFARAGYAVTGRRIVMT